MEESTITYNREKVKQSILDAERILIAVRSSPTADSFGSALSLYLGLTSLGKTVHVVCPTPMTVEHSHFVGAQKILTALLKKNFVISLDYEDGSIEKVSYNIEGKTFNLIVEPRVGHEGFSEEKVHYRHAGIVFDLIITIDVQNLEELGAVWEQDKELFSTKPIMVIDSHPEAKQFGTVQVFDPNIFTTTELVTHVLSDSGCRLTEDIATNIFTALAITTKSFSEKVTAGTFDVAAVMLRAGAKQSFPHVQEKDGEIPVDFLPTDTKSPIQENVSPKEPLPEDPKPIISPPEDWLKPKIFKSSSIA